MKPYIVRPVEPGMADVFDRVTRRPVGWLLARYVGWDARCKNCPSSFVHPYRDAAAEALWRHYLDEHKERSDG